LLCLELPHQRLRLFELVSQLFGPALLGNEPQLRLADGVLERLLTFFRRPRLVKLQPVGSGRCLLRL
jgi:hypothetical protein